MKSLMLSMLLLCGSLSSAWGIEREQDLYGVWYGSYSGPEGNIDIEAIFFEDFDHNFDIDIDISMDKEKAVILLAGMFGLTEDDIPEENFKAIPNRAKILLFGYYEILEEEEGQVWWFVGGMLAFLDGIDFQEVFWQRLDVDVDRETFNRRIHDFFLEEIDYEINSMGDFKIETIDGRLIISLLTVSVDGPKYIEIELTKDRPDDIATSVQHKTWGSIKQGALSKRPNP